MFVPKVGVRKVFISYAKEDERIANMIDSALKRFGLDPYIAVREQDPGEYISRKISEAILSSLHFIVILTKSSVTNQWVNQELGFAFALKYLNEIQRDPNILGRFPMLQNAVKSTVVPFNPIEIMPIISEGISFKGFLNGSIEYITLDEKQPEYAVYQILPLVRSKVEKHYHEKLELHTKCPKCATNITLTLPPPEEIQEAIEKYNVYTISCKSCENEFAIDPFDFSVQFPYR